MFALNCTTSMSLAGFFDAPEGNMMMVMDHHNMDESEESDCCEEVMSDCERISHECCISPVSEINITSYQSSQTKKKLLSNSDPDIEISWICTQLIIEQNCIAKAISPPELRGNIFVIKNVYSQLVWIIQNNC